MQSTSSFTGTRNASTRVMVDQTSAWSPEETCHVWDCDAIRQPPRSERANGATQSSAAQQVWPGAPMRALRSHVELGAGAKRIISPRVLAVSQPVQLVSVCQERLVSALKRFHHRDPRTMAHGRTAMRARTWHGTSSSCASRMYRRRRRTVVASVSAFGF
jgi:hypothetical protein